ncbi:MAG: MlaD family protein, partial [Gammaproteobacteria bacterium]
MSARANPVVVGGFVVGALVLLVAGVLLFGSGALLREQITVVAFFSGNVRGLQEGSPVEFRGVRVGTVTKVQLALDVDSMDLLIPVYMELEPRSLTVGGETAAQRSAGALPFLDSLVERGLRARLDLKSFVTGQLAVGLDMYPDSTIERVGAIGDVYEVPTVPSTLDRVAAILQELPLQDIAVKLIDSLDGLSRLLTEGNLDITLRETAATAADTRALVAELRSGVGPLLEHVDATVRELRAALGAVAQKTDVTLDDYR